MSMTNHELCKTACQILGDYIFVYSKQTLRKKNSWKRKHWP